MAQAHGSHLVTQTASHIISVEPAPENGALPNSLCIEKATSTSQTLKLDPSAYEQIITIVSTESGTRKAEQVHQDLIAQLFNHLSIPARTLVTTSASSIRNFTETHILPHAKAGKAQLVIILSGDGGIVDLLSVLAPIADTPNYLPPTISLIPLGTGNALGNSTGILRAGDGTVGLRTLTNGRARALPVFDVFFDPPARRLEGGTGTVNSDNTVSVRPDEAPYGVVSGAVVFSWALHAALVADSDTPEYRKLGTARFREAAKENLFPEDGKARPHSYQGSLAILPVHSDNGQWKEIEESAYYYVLATTCSQLEKGFTISPASRPLDGKLFVAYIGAVEGGGEQVMDAMKDAYDGGKHIERDDVGYEEVESIKLVVQDIDDRWRRVCVDGTIFVVPRDGKVEVRRRKGGDVLRLLVLDD